MRFFIFLILIFCINTSQAHPLTFWKNLTHQFVLNKNPKIQSYRVKYFIQQDTTPYRLEILNLEIQRAQYILPYILNQLTHNHIPADITLLPFIESGYDPEAVSSAGAKGIWQLMPSSVITQGYHPYNNWLNPQENIILSTQIAVQKLKQLNQNFQSWDLALAAYNAGAGTINGVLNQAAIKGKPTDYWSLDLPNQTANYVPKLLALEYLFQHPNQYHIHLPQYTDQNTPELITLHHQYRLYTLIQKAKINNTLFHLLNNGFKRLATPPNYNTQILLPQENAWALNAYLDLNQNKTTHQEKWMLYTIKSGDTLDQIALKFNVKANQIRQWNQLKNNQILSIGEKLVIKK